jgi:phosphoribosylaminoimidazole carboxylase PurE protein
MKVLVIMGSDSDLPVMEETVAVLDEFGVGYELTVASAHRSPARAAALAEGAEGRGFDVIVAGAGMAAHLAGVLAAHTALPVIGVPINSSALGGMDALLSTVQMPPGVPVATMALGKAGARNAGLFAVQIIARGHKKLRPKLAEFKKNMAASVEEKAAALARSRKK